MMKTNLLASALLACTAFYNMGCTTQTTASVPPRDSRQGASIDNRRSYSQEELQKRGGPTLADKLEQQDASVRIDGGAR